MGDSPPISGGTKSSPSPLPWPLLKCMTASTWLVTHVSHLETKCVGMETELVEIWKTKRARVGGKSSSTPAPATPQPLVASSLSLSVASAMYPFGTETVLVPEDAKSTDTLLKTPAAAVEELLVRTYSHSHLNRNVTCSNRKLTFYKVVREIDQVTDRPQWQVLTKHQVLEAPTTGTHKRYRSMRSRKTPWPRGAT
eukprot:4148331-Pleurochrysis_carterae.AAC.6